MTEAALTPTLEDALLALLDDDSPVVRAALVAELRRRGDLGRSLLRRAARSPHRLLAGHARSLLEELGGDDTAAEFLHYLRQARHELEDGMVRLCRVAYPDYSAADLAVQLDALAARVRELTPVPSGPRERCRVLNRVLFHERGFVGHTAAFDDPRNSFLRDVLERRRGLPLTLSVIYVLVARRTGLPLDPVALPGRFVVGCFLERPAFFLDPFEQGAARSAEDLLALVRAHGLRATRAALAPAHPTEVLARCCRNLVRQFLACGQPQQARHWAQFVRVVDGPEAALPEV